MNKIKLVIGLGNPDLEYQNTFHNVGHIFIDELLKTGGYKLKAIKTSVYMNKSGLFVKEAVKKYKVKPEQLLIIHDDSDIELGKYKLSFNRSSGGHKGIQNVMNHLKTEAFWRLRIGIRPAKEKVRAKADDLVLRKISPAAKKNLDKVFKEIKNLAIFSEKK